MASEREKNYLDAVCGHVKWKQAHDNIRRELSQHMEELREEKLREGMTEEEASEAAVREMGDSELVGVSMNKAYRPRISWNALGILVFLTALGIVFRSALYGNDHKGIMATMIGAALFYCINYILDLRWVMKYAWQIAVVYGVFGMAAAVYLWLIGDGEHYVRMMYLENLITCWTMFQPIMTVLMIRSQRGKGVFGLIGTGVFCLLTWVPILTVPNSAVAALVAAADIILVCFAIAKKEFGEKRWILFAVLFVSLGTILIVLLKSLDVFAIDRIRRAITLRNYEPSFRQYQAESFLRYSQFIGPVQFPEYFHYSPDPNMQWDYMLLLMAVKWGTWVFYAVGAVLLVSTVVFLKWCRRQKDLFVRMICYAVLLCFFLQAADYFMINLGIIGGRTISLPFISSGGMMICVNFTLMGILFSAAGSGWLYDDGLLREKRNAA